MKTDIETGERTHVLRVSDDELILLTHAASELNANGESGAYELWDTLDDVCIEFSLGTHAD